MFHSVFNLDLQGGKDKQAGSENVRIGFGEGSDFVEKSYRFSDKGRFRIVLYDRESDSYSRLKIPLPAEDDYTDARISNSGERVAFVRYNKRLKTREICLINIDGSGFRQLTRANHYSVEPFFSKDDQTIYFIRTPKAKMNSGFSLYRIGIDGRGEEEISERSYDLLNPSLSRDGETIIYSQTYTKVEHGALNQRVIKLNVNDGESRVLIDDRQTIVPVYLNKRDGILHLGRSASHEDINLFAKRNEYDRIYDAIYLYDLKSENSKILKKIKYDTYYLALSHDDRYALYYFIRDLMEYDFMTNEVRKITFDEDRIISLFEQ